MATSPKEPIKDEKETKPSSAPAEQNEGKIAVPKSTLDALIAEVKDSKKQIKMLTEVADKSRLMRYRSAHKEIELKKVRVSTLNGKIIVAWSMVTNDVYQDGQGRWHENQQVRIIFEDNTKKIISYLEFVRQITKVDGIIEKRYTTPEGHNIMRINVMKKVLDINETFIN